MVTIPSWAVSSTIGLIVVLGLLACLNFLPNHSW